MKKNLIIGIIVAVIVVATVIAIVVMPKGKADNASKNMVDTSYELGKAKLTIKTPKNEDGSPKFNFTTEKPEDASVSGDVYLRTDKAVFVFENESYVYQTATKYKEKYGVQEPSFEDFIKWSEDKDSGVAMKNKELTEINGRKVQKDKFAEGSSSNLNYYGYTYRFSLDDISKKNYIYMTVMLADEKYESSPVTFDDETTAMINSITISANK